MLVVVILDRTFVFHSETAPSTTDENDVPLGISSFTLLQACSVDIHEIPTRETTLLSSNENSAPIRVESEEEAEPLVSSTLLAEPFAV